MGEDGFIARYILNAYLPLMLCFGALFGAASYFLPPFEPDPLYAVLLLSVVSPFYISVRHHRHRFAVYLFAMSWLLFLGYSAFHTQNMTHFMANEDLNKRYWVVGRIIDLDHYETRTRFTLDSLKIYGLQKPPPERVRISTARSRTVDVDVGSWVAVEAFFTPFSPPEYKGAFDYRLWAWTQRLGATGYVMGGFYKTAPLVKTSSFRLWVERIRQHVAQRIETQVDDREHSTLITALLTGLKHGISDDVYLAFQKSGLAHLLAISGLHLGLVGGMVFFAVRRLLTLSPTLCLHTNTKALAACVAALATFAFALLAGATIPTLRAFVMLCLFFGAIMLGRIRVSLYVLSVAMLCVLLLWPESVITASFQMSFVAAFALVVWAAAWQRPTPAGVVLSTPNYISGVFACSIVAGLATMPIAAWHFHTVSFIGFVANLLAIPLTAFWILPVGLITLCLMPLGLEGISMPVMTRGVDALYTLATLTGNLPLAGHYVSSIFALIMLLPIAGLLILFMQRAYLSFCLGLIALISVLYLLPLDTPAQILWLREGQSVLYISQTGHTSLLKADGSKDEARTLHAYRRQHNLPALTPALSLSPTCDSIGCRYHLPEGVHVLTVYEGQQATEEDCRLNDVILHIADAPPPKSCNAITHTGPFSASVHLSEKPLKKVAFMPSFNRIWQRGSP